MATLIAAIDGRGARVGANQFETAGRKIQSSARKTDRAIGGLEGGISRLKLGMVAAGAVAVGFAATLASRLARSAISLSKSMVEVASQTEEIRDKFGAVFKDEGPRITSFLEDLGERTGRSSTKLQLMAAAVQDVLVPMGIARDKAADLSANVVQLGVDVGSFNNALGLSTEDVLRDFTSAIVGNIETVLKFGINLKEGELRAFAYANGIAKAGSELTEQEKILARILKLQADSTDALGNAEATAGSFANQQQRLNDRLFDMKDAMGQRLIAAIQGAVEEYGGLDAILEDVEDVMGTVAIAAEASVSSFASLAKSIDTLKAAFEEFPLLSNFALAAALKPLRDMELTLKGLEAATSEMLRQARMISDVLGLGGDSAEDLGDKAEGAAGKVAGLEGAVNALAGSGETVVEAFAALTEAEEFLRSKEIQFARPMVQTLEDRVRLQEKINALERDRLEAMARSPELDLTNEQIDEILAQFDRLAEFRLDNLTDEVQELSDGLALLADTSADLASSLGGAIGDAAVGFGTLGDNAENALRRVVSNLISAIAEATILKAVLAPIFGPAFGGQAEFLKLFGLAQGGVIGNGPTVTPAASGLITGPTILPGALGAGRNVLAGEAGPELIAPVTRLPSGEVGIKTTGMGGATFNITNVFPRSSSVQESSKDVNRSLRQMEFDLRSMAGRV